MDNRNGANGSFNNNARCLRQTEVDQLSCCRLNCVSRYNNKRNPLFAAKRSTFSTRNSGASGQKSPQETEGRQRGRHAHRSIVSVSKQKEARSEGGVDAATRRTHLFLSSSGIDGIHALAKGDREGSFHVLFGGGDRRAGVVPGPLERRRSGGGRRGQIASQRMPASLRGVEDGLHDSR